jgi:peroxiredoxin
MIFLKDQFTYAARGRFARRVILVDGDNQLLYRRVAVSLRKTPQFTFGG